MKTIKYLMLGFVLIFGISACELPDNVDPKNPSEVPPETLFTNGMVYLFNQVDEVNVNRNIDRLIVQYWQQTTYFDESRYLFQDRKIPDNYADRFYRFALMDLQETRKVLNSPDYGGDPAKISNMLNIIEICEVYGWHCVVDAFGDMPYSEALMGAENSTPVYDDAAAIYSDIINRLDVAVGALNTAEGAFGVADVFYNDNVAMWKKFGASLLFRLGMRLADVNPSLSKTTVDKAVAHGVFESQEESAMLHYPGVVPHVNAIYQHYVVDNRADYLPTNTIIDIMKERNDPRLPLWFTTLDGEYVGAVAGLDGAQSYVNFSNFADVFYTPDFPAIIMDYVELRFLMAEAAERGGYNVPGTAEEHYNAAVKGSIMYWGGTEAEADDYLAQAEVAYDAANWKESIGTQKWLALYNRGVEGWAEWRRLDFPVLNTPEGMQYSMIPKRMPYPYDEIAQNGTNYYAAVEKMGGDDQTIRVFWDTE